MEVMTDKIKIRVLMTLYSLRREEAARLLGVSLAAFDRRLYGADRDVPAEWLAELQAACKNTQNFS